MSGYPRAQVIPYATYSTTTGDNDFIGKGTLDNVIAGKGLVGNTDYATGDKGGVIKVGSAYGTSTAGGYLSCNYLTNEQYTNLSNYGFISKGTLENVLNARIGDIASVIDAINGESI